MKKRTEETVRYNFTISKKIYKSLTAHTEKNLISKNKLLEKLILEYLKKEEP